MGESVVGGILTESEAASSQKLSFILLPNWDLTPTKIQSENIFSCGRIGLAKKPPQSAVPQRLATTNQHVVHTTIREKVKFALRSARLRIAPPTQKLPSYILKSLPCLLISIARGSDAPCPFGLVWRPWVFPTRHLRVAVMVGFETCFNSQCIGLDDGFICFAIYICLELYQFSRSI